MTIAVQSILSSLSMPDPDHDHCNQTILKMMMIIMMISSTTGGTTFPAHFTLCCHLQTILNCLERTRRPRI